MDKEKILNILNYSNINTFEDLIFTYLTNYSEDFSVSRLHNLILSLQRNYLTDKISRQDLAVDVSKERATYLKIFLEGKMYTTKEAAIKSVPKQIENAETIIEMCKRCK